MNKFIISDASPIIAFGRIDKISLLFDLLGKVIIPGPVASECLTQPLRSGAFAIQRAIDTGIAEITVHPEHLCNAAITQYNLGIGETAAISLAIHTQYPLLIDEKHARKVANKFQIKIIGTAGVLLLAKKKQLIKKVSPLLSELKQSGYRLSNELVKEILQQAKEKM